MRPGPSLIPNPRNIISPLKQRIINPPNIRQRNILHITPNTKLPRLPNLLNLFLTQPIPKRIFVLNNILLLIRD